MVEAQSPTMLWRRWTPVQVTGNQSVSLYGAPTTRWWALPRAMSTSLESPQRTSLEEVNRWRLTFQSLHSILTVSKNLSQKFCQWFVRSEFVKMPFDSHWDFLAKILMIQCLKQSYWVITNKQLSIQINVLQLNPMPLAMSASSTSMSLLSPCPGLSRGMMAVRRLWGMWWSTRIPPQDAGRRPTTSLSTSVFIRVRLYSMLKYNTDKLCDASFPEVIKISALVYLEGHVSYRNLLSIKKRFPNN